MGYRGITDFQYFKIKEFISNSELKRLFKMAGGGYEEPENLDRIFEFGTLVHAILFEPLKANTADPDYALAKQMARTFLNDPMCMKIMGLADLRCEHEFYRYDVFGFNGKCKADGESRMMDLILEFKSLSCTTQRQFEDAIDRFDYDQGGTWYIHTGQRRRVLIAAVSKKEPKMIFKKLIERGDSIYNRGLEKIDRSKRAIDTIMGDISISDLDIFDQAA